MNPIQSHNRYSDALALKRRRAVIKKLSLLTLAGLALVVATGYFLFFSPYLQITDISVNGLKVVAPGEIESLIDSTIFNNIISVLRIVDIKTQKSIIFFDVAFAKDKILAQFPIIKSAEIKKDYPHKITIDLTERSPIGTWCFNDICYYFDDKGILWGEALRSSGSLLLTVEDKNKSINNPTRIEPGLIESIKKIVAGLDTLDIGIKGIEIPVGSINDIRINTAKDYYILADTSSNIDKQLDTLRIFLKNKGADIHPEYIDIRIEGRVYYK